MVFRDTLNFIENQIDTSHLDKFYQKLHKINEIQRLPPANDTYKFYFNQEKFASWTDSYIDTKQLDFKSALTNIWISQYKIEIHYPKRFYLLSNEIFTFPLMQYVFDLISQLGGNEAIFLPDSIPFAQMLSGSVRNPIIKQGIPEKSHWGICSDIYHNKIYKTGIPFADIKQAVKEMYGEPSFKIWNLTEKKHNGYLLEDFKSFKLKNIIHDKSIEPTHFTISPEKKTPKWVLKYLYVADITPKKRQCIQKRFEVSKNYTAYQLAKLYDSCIREGFLNICEKNNWPRLSDIKKSFLEDRIFRNRLSDSDYFVKDFFEMIIDQNISLKEFYSYDRISKQAYTFLQSRKIDKPEELMRFYYKIRNTYPYEKITDNNNRLLQEILDFIVTAFWENDYRKLTKEAFEKKVEDWKRLVRTRGRKKRNS